MATAHHSARRRGVERRDQREHAPAGGGGERVTARERVAPARHEAVTLRAVPAHELLQAGLGQRPSDGHDEDRDGQARASPPASALRPGGSRRRRHAVEPRNETRRKKSLRAGVLASTIQVVIGSSQKSHPPTAPTASTDTRIAATGRIHRGRRGSCRRSSADGGAGLWRAPPLGTRSRGGPRPCPRRRRHRPSAGRSSSPRCNLGAVDDRSRPAPVRA